MAVIATFAIALTSFLITSTQLPHRQGTHQAAAQLAQDGLEPSESNPQFHQQMVYAVAMNTIQSFERALGRRVMWAPRLVVGDEEQGQQ